MTTCDNTWQADNRWPGGDSVYTSPKGTQGPWNDLSFDRPYGKYCEIYENLMTSRGTVRDFSTSRLGLRTEELCRNGDIVRPNGDDRDAQAVCECNRVGFVEQNCLIGFDRQNAGASAMK